jgi:hypothetical protein
MICCQTTRNAIAESRPEDMRRATVEGLNIPSYIGRTIVEDDAL